MENLQIGLEIMAKGMGGIFVAMAVIAAAVFVMSKLVGKKKAADSEAE